MYTAYSTQQQGKTFGERLSNETQKIFDKGYEKIIIIGNDSPDLNSKTIIDAANSCTDSKTVLGPSTDGGVYLIALHINNFNPALFAQLDWESENLQQSFQTYITQQAVDLRWLHTLQDLDSEAQVKAIVDTLAATHVLKSFLIALLETKSFFCFHYNSPYFQYTYQQLTKLRGPPYIIC